MSWRTVRRLLPALLLCLVVRVLLALPLAAEPRAWVAAATRHQPRGELAILDRGGALLLELWSSGDLPRGMPAQGSLLGLLAALLALLPFGALVLSLRGEDTSLSAALGRAASRWGGLILISGAGVLLLAAVTSLQLFIATLVLDDPEDAPLPWLVAMLLSVPVPAAVAAFTDALRARCLLCDEGFLDRVSAMWERLSGSALELWGRYLVSASLQLGVTLLSLVLLVRAVGAPTLSFGLACLGSLLLLALALLARAWFLAHLVKRLDQPLHAAQEVGYESAPSHEVGPDSSVGRAED